MIKKNIIRLKLITGKCKINSNLSRILGQYQINVMKFCTQFNQESSNYYIPGLLFYVFIDKKNKNFLQIIIGSPCLKFLLDQYFNKNNKIMLLITELYDLYQIYKYLSNKNINLKCFFGFINSINVIIINEK